MQRAGVSICPAVVLKRTDFGESDRIVTLFTSEWGKVSVFARGARRSQKRFGAGLDLFAIIDAAVRMDPQRDLWGLEEIQAAEHVSHVSLQWDCFACASYACELVRESCPAHQPDLPVFTLLVALLRDLDRIAQLHASPLQSIVEFQIQLLRLLGLGWEMDVRNPLFVFFRTLEQGEETPVDSSGLLRQGFLFLHRCFQQHTGRPLQVADTVLGEALRAAR